MSLTLEGIPRLDTLDLMEGAPSNYDRSKLPWLVIIKDAAYCYQCFGLGNSITPQEFWEAYCYLFKARSDNPGSWGDRRRMVTCYDQGGARKINRLNDDEMKLQCFDIHYVLSGLSSLCDMSDFIIRIKKIRKDIVIKYRDQIQDYVNSKQDRCKRIGRGQQTELGIMPDLEHAMIEPACGYEVAKLFYDSRKTSQPAKTKWKGRKKWLRNFQKKVAK